ncbi:hypothetical protein [Nonomuraea rubra]|uniref:FAD/NAD(P)-binding domain-containing protein n=1 Tax=Nonomuraea rubra TaxID=46180 RepID=A0A7X0NWD3_9ACTN|nr:hypothetical protein [Nonomuraea rubra]MBB6550887.1 hypothetical protein [Nonomuraea rubra]
MALLRARESSRPNRLFDDPYARHFLQAVAPASTPWAAGPSPATARFLQVRTGGGLPLGDGVHCDAQCRAAPGVYAAGDLASWYDEWLGRRLRLENRTNAVDQAQIIAANILGEGLPYTPVPYFWTDHYDRCPASTRALADEGGTQPGS